MAFAIFLDFKARDIKMQENGAAMGILIFFFQSLTLFGAFSAHSLIGAVGEMFNLEIATSAAEESAGDEKQCSLKLDPRESFFLTCLFLPVFLVSIPVSVALPLVPCDAVMDSMDCFCCCVPTVDGCVTHIL